jgi:DNA-directed RNA polymerase specialized sigma24 family protein
MKTSPPSAAELAAHAGWVTALARQLAHDSATADDLTQDAFTTWLDQPARALREPRAWLVRVMRNRALERSRTEGRRREHERAAARPEAIASGAELVARAEAQRRLVDHVLMLA